MRYQRIILAAALCTLPLSYAQASPQDDTDHCNNIHMGDWDKTVVRAEEDLTVPNSGSPLKVIAQRNGGVSVRGSDTGNFKVHVCKVAAADTKAEADRLLSQIKVQASGSTLQPSGPEGGDWTAFIMIEAPRTASVEAETTNGPLSFRDMQGSLTATAKNGPVSFKNVSGSVTANVQNGPVSYRGNSGDIKLTSHNGPLDLRLDGENWNGGGLRAETTNGPLSLSLPDSFHSGVEINTDGRAPISCRMKGCESVQRVSENGQRRISLGSGAPVVRISTHNGPVMIGNSQAEY